MTLSLKNFIFLFQLIDFSILVELEMFDVILTLFFEFLEFRLVLLSSFMEIL